LPWSNITGLDIDISSGVLEGIPLHIPVDPETSSVFNVAKEWVMNCTKSHIECGKRSGSQLPTRVIDVGSAKGLEAPRIIVTQGGRDEYVTLSHRWTDVARQFATTRENLEARLQAIPLASFPPTFRDAIIITRRLSYRYLWIDSICIVQNDEMDWEGECQKMCDVFENSVFSISALRDSDGTSGILKERQLHQSLILHLEDGTRIGVRPVPQNFKNAIRSSAMETRGWILQERILSPAILHIGQSQMYWECCSHTASEYQPQWVSHSEGRLKHLVVMAQRQSPKREAPDPYLEWYKMLGIFTSKSLTVELDRLPAIIGLAHRFQNLVNATFVAGLWLEDLHRGLLWMKEHSFGKTLNHGHSNLPSWSWIQVVGNVVFEGKDAGYKEDPGGPHSVYPTLRETASTDIDIIDVDVSTRLPNRHRRLRGFIQAWGLLVRVTYQRSAKTKDFRLGYLSRGKQSHRGSLPCTIDFLCDELKDCFCLVIADWVFEWVFDGFFGKKNELAIPKQRCYLVLSRVKRPPRNANPLSLGEFRRIGVGGDDPSMVERFFGSTRKRFLTLI
jgi:hypothetical protein